jgi:hypothetical protein
VIGLLHYMCLDNYGSFKGSTASASHTGAQSPFSAGRTSKSTVKAALAFTDVGEY